jgi:hypothetical protein
MDTDAVRETDDPLAAADAEFTRALEQAYREGEPTLNDVLAKLSPVARSEFEALQKDTSLPYGTDWDALFLRVRVEGAGGNALGFDAEVGRKIMRADRDRLMDDVDRIRRRGRERFSLMDAARFAAMHEQARNLYAILAEASDDEICRMLRHRLAELGPPDEAPPPESADPLYEVLDGVELGRRVRQMEREKLLRAVRPSAQRAVSAPRACPSQPLARRAPRQREHRAGAVRRRAARAGPGDDGDGESDPEPSAPRCSRCRAELLESAPLCGFCDPKAQIRLCPICGDEYTGRRDKLTCGCEACQKARQRREKNQAEEEARALVDERDSEARLAGLRGAQGTSRRRVLGYIQAVEHVKRDGGTWEVLQRLLAPEIDLGIGDAGLCSVPTAYLDRMLAVLPRALPSGYLEDWRLSSVAPEIFECVYLGEKLVRPPSRATGLKWPVSPAQCKSRYCRAPATAPSAFCDVHTHLSLASGTAPTLAFPEWFPEQKLCGATIHADDLAVAA